MRLLVPAASAALMASLALSATAAAPGAGAPVSSAGTAQVSAAHPQVARSALPTAAVHRTRTGTTTVTGADTASPPTPVAADTASRPTLVAPSAGFTWPLSPPPAILRRFEQPLRQWSPGHRGVDLLAAVGQPVLSAGDGIVAFSGVIAGRGVITVRHPGGLRTSFEPVDERLASGTVVLRGTRIGVLSPSPGHCLPRHCLHWGAISGQAYRDPLSLLGFGRPVLLPLG